MKQYKNTLDTNIHTLLPKHQQNCQNTHTLQNPYRTINFVINTPQISMYNKILLIIITFSPTCFCVYCAIFKENNFVCSKLLLHIVSTWVCNFYTATLKIMFLSMWNLRSSTPCVKQFEIVLKILLFVDAAAVFALQVLWQYMNIPCLVPNVVGSARYKDFAMAPCSIPILPFCV